MTSSSPLTRDQPIQDQGVEWSVSSDGVGTIRFVRPKAANTLDLAVATQLAEAAHKVADARVVVLRSTGRFFSAGGDLRTFSGEPTEVARRIRATAEALHEAVLALRAADAPVIAEVQGPAAGAGMSIVAGADLVVASTAANFTFGYTAAGLTPDGGATYFLPRLIGARRTFEFAVSNRTVDAKEAQSWGLVTTVVEPDDLTAATDALAVRVAGGPTGAFGALKRLLVLGQDAGLEDLLRLEVDSLEKTAASDHGQEGIAAFLGKRPPTFAPPS